MSLMIDIPTVLPVGVLSLIVTHLLSRCIALGQGSQLALGRHDFEWCESGFVSRG